MKPTPPSIEAVAKWLRGRGSEPSDVRLLQGGAWSSAFAYRDAAGERVVKFGAYGSDYAKDAAVALQQLDGVPVAAVLERGTAFSMHFAIVEFVSGEPFDALPAHRFARAFEHLLTVLAALHSVVPVGNGYGLWVADEDTLLPQAPSASWREYLFAVSRRDDARLAGWQDALARYPHAQRLYLAAQQALDRGIARCIGPRRLLHMDLLNRNLLVGADDRVAALLDWGCAMLGDPLYEYANLLFAAAWYPGLDRDRLTRVAWSYGGADVAHRLWSYRLAVALEAMQYQAFAGLENDLRGSAEDLEALLDLGDES